MLRTSARNSSCACLTRGCRARSAGWCRLGGVLRRAARLTRSLARQHDQLQLCCLPAAAPGGRSLGLRVHGEREHGLLAACQYWMVVVPSSCPRSGAEQLHRLLWPSCASASGDRLLQLIEPGVNFPTRRFRGSERRSRERRLRSVADDAVFPGMRHGESAASGGFELALSLVLTMAGAAARPLRRVVCRAGWQRAGSVCANSGRAESPGLATRLNSKGENGAPTGAGRGLRVVRTARRRCGRHLADWRIRGAAGRAAARARDGAPRADRYPRELAENLLQRQQALQVDQLHQSQLQVQARLLAVVQLVEGAQHHLQEAGEILFAEESGACARRGRAHRRRSAAARSSLRPAWPSGSCADSAPAAAPSATGCCPRSSSR